MIEKQIIQESAQFRMRKLCAILMLSTFVSSGGLALAKPTSTKVVNAKKSETAKRGASTKTDNEAPNSEQIDAAIFDKAKELLSSHKFSQAEELLSKLTNDYPDDPRLHMLYGDLLEQSGRLDEASKEFARVAELDSSDPQPTINLARICLKQLELELSLTYAQQAVARDPSFLPARIALMETLIACDQTGEAERQLRFISEKDKSKKSVQKLAYKLALKKGDFAGAHQYLTNVNQAEHMEANAKAREKAIDAANADRNGNQTDSASDSDGEISALEEIDLLETLGQYQEARQKLEEMVSAEADSDTFAARLKLARLLESRFHDYDAALSNFNEALEIDPLSATAIAGRDRCRTKRRNLALQLKIWLREFWAQQQLAEKQAPTKRH